MDKHPRRYVEPVLGIGLSHADVWRMCVPMPVSCGKTVFCKTGASSSWEYGCSTY
jgi:hypothetical protein